jgi:hypothetical protein
MAETVTGLVLAEASSSEAQAIAGLPGLWSTEPELSVVPADLGLDAEELAHQAVDLGFEVRRVEWEREAVADADETKLTVSEIEERIESFTDEELDALASDERKGAREAAEAEIARRLDAEGGS